MFKKLHIPFFKVLVLGILGFVLGFSNPGQGSELVQSWRVLGEAGYTAAKADILTLKLFNRVDELGEGALKTKLLSKLDDAELVKFSDDFGEAANETFTALKNNESLIDYWKSNQDLLRNKAYPTSGNIDWNTARNNIISNGNAVENKVLDALEKRFASQPPTLNNQKVMAVAYCDELGGEVDISRIRQIRNAGGDAGNFGYVRGNINGKDYDIVKASGEANVLIEPQIFETIEVAGKDGVRYLRNTDSEYKMLNDLADKLGGAKGVVKNDISGELKIVSELQFCTSCRGVIQQFNEMFPNIKIVLVNGAR
jgi:hypothetical protein